MKSDMENKEWLNDYMSLKQVNPVNPFTVPQNYFESLTNRIISYNNLSEITNNDPLAGFTLPENYIETLTGNIRSRIAIENEANKENVGFTIPETYFHNLEQQIKSRVYIEEALNNPGESFTVPESYFDKLNKNVLDKTVNLVDSNNRRTGVIRKLFATTAMKYATAACFALVIGGGILLNELNSSTNEHKNSFLHKQLSGVSVDDIKSYLQLNEDAGDTQQAVATEGTSVDDNQLKNALQNNIDSVQ